MTALPRADYSDSFGTPTDGPRSALDWAQATFERSPRHDWKAQLVWRGVLQLRLAPRGAPGHVAGWRVVEEQPARLVVTTTSWHLRAWLVWECTDDEARVTTRLVFRRPAGRVVWTVLGGVHRRAVPGLLAAARRRLR